MVIARNTFTGSLIRDSEPYLSSQNSWGMALNAVNRSRNTKGFGLVNEESNKLADKIESGKIVGSTFIDERNKTLIFTDADELYFFNHETNKMEFIASADEFGCQWNLGECEYHYAETKTLGNCNELYAYFSSKCEYYVVNLDELFDEKRKEAIKGCFKEVGEATSCEYSCDYFKLFKCICTPKLATIPSEGGGYGLRSGVYQFAVQLQDSDGNSTNWSYISQPTSVGSEDNIGNQASNQLIELNLSALDCRYSRVNIAVISTINGVQTVEVLDAKNYSTNDFTYTYYGQDGRTTTLDEITTKKRTYIQGQDLIQQDGRLWLYGVKNERNLDYQSRAYQIQTKIAEFEVTAEQQKKYHYKSFMRSERYLLGIVWNYCDGTSSKTFLLQPGDGSRVSTPNSNAPAPAPSNSSAGPSASSVEIKHGEYIRKRAHSDTGASAPQNESQTTDKVKADLENWDTELQNVVEAAKCVDCSDCDEIDPRGCCGEDEDGNPIFTPYEGPLTEGTGDTNNCEGCDEASNALANDGPDIQNIVTDASDELANQSYDPVTTQIDDSTNPIYPEKPKPTSATIKDAATNLLEYGVENDEVIELIGSQVIESQSTTSSSGAALDRGIRSDKFVPSSGENLTEEAPRYRDLHDFISFQTENEFPDTKNCQGEFLWGDKQGTPLHLFEIPSAATLPPTRSGAYGVPSNNTPDKDEFGDMYINLLGLEVTIPEALWPTAEELTKPLCGVQPYRVVYVERDKINKRVLAKGLSTGTFLGDVRGGTYAFPRHGVNSFETVDRFVDEGGSRIATGGEGPGYNFHSLDSSILGSGYNADQVLVEGLYHGVGARHGLYAEGEIPADRENEGREDQRGTRQQISLNEFHSQFRSYAVEGIQKAYADSRVTPVAGITHSLMNKYRESSLYYQPSNNFYSLAGSNGFNGPGKSAFDDNSFVGDGLSHSSTLRGSAHYTALVRDNPTQYGGPENLRFIDTGIVGKRPGVVRGICGDTFIGPHSFLRTGYVSNKVGVEHETSKGLRTICQTPEDSVFERLGQWHPTQLPIEWDTADAKNFSNLHPGKFGGTALLESAPEADFYYPKTVKTLITYWGEFEVNPYLRATGDGNQKDGLNVFYPKLKDLDVDSNGVIQAAWEDSYLNKIAYHSQPQPSPAQLSKLSWIRTLLDLIIPIGGTTILGVSLDGVIDTTAAIYTIPALLSSLWFANRKLFTVTRLRKLLGIPTCEVDDQGVELEEKIRNLRDNYYAYNWDHSKTANEIGYFSMSSTYNTCVCDTCSKENLSNDIYYSNKQLLDSEIDSYSNFKANNYGEISSMEGQLKKMFSMNGRFFGHTTEGIFLIQYKLASINSSLGKVYLGGDLLLSPVRIKEGVDEGYAGLFDPNAAKVTKYGYIFVDRDASKVYMFNGQDVDEISNRGMEMWFKEKLNFCEDSDCYDEKDSEGIYYSIGVDPLYERILLTKKDIDEDDSFTMSYDPAANEGRGGWISFHSYLPNDYIYDRNTLYSIKDDGVWEHNIEGEYQEFYGEYYPHKIEFTAISTSQNKSLSSFSADAQVMRTEADQFQGEGYIKDLDKTFNYIHARNDTETTGIVPLKNISDNYDYDEDSYDKISKDDHIETQKDNRLWNINGIVNLINEDCEDHPLTLVSKCEAIERVNTSIASCDKKAKYYGGNKSLVDDYITYRLILDNQDTKTRLKTLSFVTEDSNQQ